MGYKTMKKAVGRHGAPPGILPAAGKGDRRGVQKILKFTREQIEEDRKSRKDLDSLEERFRRKFKAD